MRQLSALDAQFLALETEANYGHVGSLAILEPPLSFDALKRLLASRLHLVPPFTSRLEYVPLGLDWPYWVQDEHFDLDYHVREIALPAPGSMAQLSEQVARIYSRRLDRSRPLWELYLISGLEDGCVALVTKVHHAAVDGMSGAEILSLLYDVAPEPREVDPPSGDDVPPASSRIQLLGRAAAALPGAPVRGAGRLARLLPHVDVLPSVMGVPGAQRISRTVSGARKRMPGLADDRVIERPRIKPPAGAYDGRVSPHRVFGLASVSLADVKAVKNHFGVTVNDVVVSMVSGAVREHLHRHGLLPDEPLVAQIPVSVRTEDERGTFGNQVSAMFVPIPTHLADAASRVRDAAEHLRAAKDRHAALPAKALSDVTQFIPPALHALAARTIVEVSPKLGFKPPFNIIISNVPGPPIDVYSAGARLRALYPLSIIADGAGLNVTLMSYKDEIHVGITADRRQTPDVQSIADGLPDALNELLAAV